MKISIIVPFYNEEDNIDIFMSSLYKNISSIKGINFEYIFIDDGSNDKTLFELKKYLNKGAFDLKIIGFSRNFGHEAAINAGICKCSGDAAIIMDADLQDPPEVIVSFIEAFKKGYDVVNAKRIDRNSDRLFKRTTAKIFYKFIKRWSYKIHVEENVNNFRLISRKVINVIKSLSSKNKVFRFEVPYSGFKSTNIEIVRSKRANGRSHYNLSSMSRLAIDSVVSVSIQPLNLITKIFLVIFGLTILSCLTELILYLIQVISKIIYVGEIYLLIWLITNILLLLSSLVLFCIAIVAQYIARIHLETQNRPVYIIDKVYENK